MISGIVGYIALENYPIPSEMRGSYRYVEKKGSFAADVSDFGDSLLNYLPALPDSAAGSAELSKTIQSILPYKNYIHTENILLENPEIPDRIAIPAINLVAPIVVSDFNLAKVEGETFGQWVAPSKFAAGWHPDSALLGQKGNTVINGHHNEYGEVFGKLVDLEVGDLIIVRSGDKEYRFVVANKMIIAERFQPAEVRLENARWLGKTDDVRLTLVTCYPKETNTHRLIIVARMVEN